MKEDPESAGFHQVSPRFLYESLYNLLIYFHSWLWADLKNGIPSRPVAVIGIKEASGVIHCKLSIIGCFKIDVWFPGKGHPAQGCFAALPGAGNRYHRVFFGKIL